MLESGGFGPEMDSAMSPTRTLLIAIVLGFVGGFLFVSVANSAVPAAPAVTEGSYSAAG
jgi:hypothetical protein